MLPVTIDKSSSQPAYRQLYLALRELILSGALAQGTRIPSLRELAAELQVSRTTVESAYGQLTVEGFLETRPQSGYFVAAGPRPARREPWHPAAEQPSFVRFDFSTARMDGDVFDFALWRRTMNKTLHRTDRLLAYSDPQGEIELREQLARYVYEVRSVLADPADIVVGAGVQSLLQILCRLIKKRGGEERALLSTGVAFERPIFRKGKRIFRDYGFPIIRLPEQEDTVSALRRTGAGAFYFCPSHRYAAGGAPFLTDRSQLLSWAAGSRGLLIEDDCEGEIRFAGQPLPALQGLDRAGRVVYLNALSRLVLPSSRVSFMVLPPALSRAYRAGKNDYNQTCSTAEQLALASFIEEGELLRHIKKLRRACQYKSKLLAEAVETVFGGRAVLAPQSSGFTAVLELTQDPRSAEELCHRALLKGIRLSPTEKAGERPRFLLCTAGLKAGEIGEAVQALSDSWYPL